VLFSLSHAGVFRMSASLVVCDDGVAVVTLKNPPMNALAPAVLMSLQACLAQAQADAAVKAVVVQGDAGKFSAGFDISFLAKQQATGDTTDFGSDVNAFLIKLLEAGAKPTVAGAQPQRRSAARADAAPSLPRTRSDRQRRPRRRPGGGHGLQRARGQCRRAARPPGAAAGCAFHRPTDDSFPHRPSRQALSPASAAPPAFPVWLAWRRR